MAISQPTYSSPVVQSYGDLAVELCSFSYGDGIWLLFAVFLTYIFSDSSSFDNSSVQKM